MISFYPGPSRVYNKIPDYVIEAYSEGILSVNHRSETFINLCSSTQKILRDNLKIPADYMIFFTSSATECWEIIAQSFPASFSYHFYNGAFGEKWFRYTKKLKKKSIGYNFPVENALNPESIDISAEAGIICITQNETSNGTAVSEKIIRKFREGYPDHLLAVDATSSLGGIHLPIDQADIWYASVQKCFGLPAGLGVMICSPNAMQAVLDQKENNHYNSLLYMREMMKDYQTTYTPNVLGIYLLKRTQEDGKDIFEIQKKLEKRAAKWYGIFDNSKALKPLVKSKKSRSTTVVTVSGKAEDIKAIKEKALAQGMILGNGYGDLKETTFRIANFPALKGKEVKQLRNFLKSLEVK